MIPQRIYLKGFLSYQEEQEICFDRDSVWLLAGPNGSGKSAIFDAMTFALFGYHRGGQHHAQKLVNRHSTSLVVELDFLLEEHLYQVRRTLKKTARGPAQATRQVRCRQPGSRANGRWEEIPDTTSQVGFDQWIRDNLGLTYETFTSSVLLLQGKADNLLLSRPPERSRILNRLVGLERYERLADRANERRRGLEERRQDLDRQLALLPDVGDAELAEAEHAIRAAREELEQARAEVDRAQRLALQAEHWQGLHARLASAREEWRQTAALQAAAAAIERDWQRWNELRTILPTLMLVNDHRTRLAESARLTEDLARERDDLVSQARHLVADLSRSRQEGLQLLEGMTADEERRQTLAARLPELAAILTRADLCSRQHQEVVRLQKGLAELPTDLADRHELAQKEYQRLADLRAVLPPLTRLAAERNELARCQELARQAARAERLADQQAADLVRDQETVSREAEAARQAHAEVRDRATAARTRLEEATDQRDQFLALEGAKTCRHCGQPLTPAHFELENQRREAERVRAEAHYRQTAEAAVQAARAEKQQTARQADVDRRLASARERLAEERRRGAQAERDARRHAAECTRIYQELAEPFRSHVHPSVPADWVPVLFPKTEDLEQFRREVAGLASAEKQLRQAQAFLEQRNQLHVALETQQRTLASLEADLPGDLPLLQQEHARLEKEFRFLGERLIQNRGLVRAKQEIGDRLQKQVDTLRQQRAGVEQTLATETVRCEEWHKALAGLIESLPGTWADRGRQSVSQELPSWQAEKAELDRLDTEARYRRLQEARRDSEALRSRIAGWEADLEGVPEEARRSPGEVQEIMTQAQHRQAERETGLRQAEQALADRERCRLQKQDLAERYRQVDRQWHVASVLAKFLGREGLQLHLVRRAERAIVDYANAVLDGLSGGDLRLRLSGEGSADEALNLEAYSRTSGQDPIDVEFLSGSQRFRVAVSLALGIGQYASRQHRPIKTVIIDEGFGCLDRQGRQVMIQELKNLRGQMRCILLVSHQEEFADAFADGYRFELLNGTTRATRFLR